MVVVVVVVAYSHVVVAAVALGWLDVRELFCTFRVLGYGDGEILFYDFIFFFGFFVLSFGVGGELSFLL